MELEGIGEFVDSSIGNSSSNRHLYLWRHLNTSLRSLAPNSTVTEIELLVDSPKKKFQTKNPDAANLIFSNVQFTIKCTIIFLFFLYNDL